MSNPRHDESCLADETSNQLTQGCWLALGCFLAYWLSFRLNALFNPWVEIMPGVALVFLPAGVKLVSILVADKWGLIGVGLAALWMASDVWSTAGILPLLGNILVWLGVPYLVVRLMLAWLKIDEVLSKLSFWNLLAIDVVATTIQAIASNLYAISVHGRDPRDLFYGTAGTILGDFIGTGVMLALMLIGVTWWQQHQRSA